MTVTGNGEGSTYLPSQAPVYPPTYVKPTAYSYPAAYTHKTFVKTPATGYGHMAPHSYVPVKSHVTYPSNPMTRYVRGPTNYVLPGRHVVYVKPSAGIHAPPHAGYKPNTQLPVTMKYVGPKQPTAVKQLGTNHVTSGQSGAVKGHTSDNGYLVHLYENYGDGLKVKVKTNDEGVYKGVYAGSKSLKSRQLG